MGRKDTDIADSHEEVGDDSNVGPLPGLGLRGRPVQRVQDVLTEGRKETICHLTKQRTEDM